MEQNTDESISNDTADSRPAEEEGQDSRARRRDQVRRAQRTHRDRKAVYVKALEHEIAKLRARDVAHDEEIREYREIIRRLRDLLLSHQIPIPSDLPKVQIKSPLAMIEVLDEPNEPQRIQAHMPAFDAGAPYPFERGTVKARAQSGSASNVTDPSLVTDSSNSLNNDASMQDPSRHPYGLNSSQVGIDFVLALEHPCLYHHQMPNPELAGSIATSHELMVQSTILRSAPALQVKGQQRCLQSSSKWNVPAWELEKLLSFSEGLDLEGEVTPIQAWQRIRNHAKFGTFTPGALETLRESLLSFVQCYGFGAVMDEAHFEQMIEQTFA